MATRQPIEVIIQPVLSLRHNSMLNYSVVATVVIAFTRRTRLRRTGKTFHIIEPIEMAVAQAQSEINDIYGSPPPG